MKKIFILLVSFLAFSILYAQEDNFEPVYYQTAAGANFELGAEANLYGVQIKQFLNHWHAINGQIMFDSKMIVMGLDYSYNNVLPFIGTISWYAGGGAQVAFLNKRDDTSIALRPLFGLEFRAKGYPIVVNAEIKPYYSIGKGSKFEFSRFGFGVKYILTRDIW